MGHHHLRDGKDASEKAFGEIQALLEWEAGDLPGYSG